MKDRREGFTLLELLIVIVVIGVLSAMMMMSASEMIATAKATQIISDMKHLQRAAMAWYFDNESRLGLTQSDGYHIDAKKGSDGYYTGGKKFHEVLLGKNSEITKYLSGSAKNLNTGKQNYSSNNNNEYFAPLRGYALYMGKRNTVCYVVYKISENNKATEETKLKAKLKARAKEQGLLSYKFINGSTADGKSKSIDFEYNGIDANIFIRAFEL